MNAHHRIHITPLSTVGGALLLGVTIALATPALRNVEHRIALAPSVDHDHPATANPKAPASFAIVERHIPDTHRALTEMHAHAARHLDEFDILPETFGATESWSGRWHLQWVDVDHRGEVVRVYHATHKHHPSVRYTAMWRADGAAPWEAAH